jgi:hypothetical protein
MSKRKLKPPRTEADLRARQSELVIQIGVLKTQLHSAECELIQVDAQLGVTRDQHPASSGRDTSGLT